MGGREVTEQAELAASRFIAQRETGPWADEDAAAFQQWLGESTLHRVVYYRLNAAWQEAGRLKALSVPGSAASAVGQPAFGEPAVGQEPAREHETSRVFSRKWALAACILLTVLGSATAYWYTAIRNTYSTAVGAMLTVPLPDGSRVTLNTDSRVRVSLGERVREVELARGEAFFEVAHDPSRPFVVRVGERRVVAVGTRFAVRRENHDVKVVVTEGVVRLEGRRSPQSQPNEVSSTAPARTTGSANLLPAGTVATAAPTGVVVRTRPLPEVERSLSWREGLLTFHDTPLAAAVAEFNRYNTRKIVIRDPVVAGTRVGGVFGATQPLQFVRLLEGGVALQVTVENDEIVLTARE